MDRMREIHCYVFEEEYDKLKAHAWSIGMTVGNFVVMCMREHLRLVAEAARNDTAGNIGDSDGVGDSVGTGVRGVDEGVKVEPESVRE